jgi:hypothetical protein
VLDAPLVLCGLDRADCMRPMTNDFKARPARFVDEREVGVARDAVVNLDRFDAASEVAHELACLLGCGRLENSGTFFRRLRMPGPFAMKLVLLTIRGPTRAPASACSVQRRLSSAQAMNGSPG